MIRCPKCNYFKVATERRPDGNSKCIACQHEAPTKEFDVKNWDWIDQETQKQLDKLKSLMSVQLDMLEQNKQMSAEIDQLKKENEKLFSVYEDCRSDNTAHFRKIMELQKENEQLKSKLKVAVEALEFYSKGFGASWSDENGKHARQALKENERLYQCNLNEAANLFDCKNENAKLKSKLKVAKDALDDSKTWINHHILVVGNNNVGSLKTALNKIKQALKEIGE